MRRIVQKLKALLNFFTTEENQATEKILQSKEINSTKRILLRMHLVRENLLRPKIMLPIVIGVFLLKACSPKEWNWEEEVLLNTGEIIWVKRTITYSLQGGGDNPMDIAFRRDKSEKISFKWNSKDYVFEGYPSPLVLAISPLKQPALVAVAGDYDWDWQYSYYCTTPHYVQFNPDLSGRTWIWPSQIEPWLFNLPRNLMSHRGGYSEMLARYSIKQREKEDQFTFRDILHANKIEPSYVSKHCKKGELP